MIYTLSYFLIGFPLSIITLMGMKKYIPSWYDLLIACHRLNEKDRIEIEKQTKFIFIMFFTFLYPGIFILTIIGIFGYIFFKGVSKLIDRLDL